MSLNPKITKDPKTGNYRLEWTPDPTAEGYAFQTPTGKSRTFDPTLAHTNLGKPPEPVMASVAVLDVTQRAAESATYPPKPIPPDPVPPASILELNGTFDLPDFRSRIPAGTKLIRPTNGGQINVRFIDKADRWLPSGIAYERSTFDGLKYCPGIWMPGMTDFKFLGSTFKNFFEEGVDGSHSEAMYIGGGCARGLIDQCLFDNNGTTSHIFFTSFTHLPAGTPHPRDICIRRTRFVNCHNPWYSIQMHNDVIPDGSTNNINIDPSCTTDGPGFQMWVRGC